jgi:hypothetical protein
MEFNKILSLSFVAFVIGSVLIVAVGCGDKNKSNRDKQSLAGAPAAISSRIPEAQTQIQQSQVAARQYNIDAKWEEVSEPFIEGNSLQVPSTIVYNGKYYEVISSHTSLGNSRLTTFSSGYSLSDGVSLVVEAKCSNENCDQYVVSYSFKKGGSDAIQLLVWVDFAQGSAARIHSAKGGQFWDINSWYNFASDTNNFLDP